MNRAKFSGILSKVSITVFAVISLFPGSAEGNPDIRSLKNSFGLGPCVSYLQVRDDLLVPLRFSGPGISLLLLFERDGVAYKHELNIKAGLAFLHDLYGFSGAVLSPALDYRYLHSIAGSTRDGGIFLGGQFSWSLNDEFFYDWDEEHLYWLTAIELGPSVRYSRSVKRDQQIQITLSLPLVALVSRPPVYRYNKTDDLTKIGFLLTAPHEDLHFSFLDTYQAAQISVAYEKRRLRVKYAGSFAHATEPEPVILFTNSIDVTWRFQW